MTTHRSSTRRSRWMRAWAVALACALLAPIVRAAAPLHAVGIAQPTFDASHRTAPLTDPPDRPFEASTESPAHRPSPHALPIFLAGSPRAAPPAARLEQASSPSIFKSASAITVTFNEVFTYTIVFTIPANTTITNAVLVDNLPDNNPNTEPNFIYVNGSSIGPTPGPGTPPIGAITPTVGSGNHVITWTLGTISNTTPAPYVYSFTYRALVVGGENRVEVGTNAAALSYAGGSANASTAVTVARAFPEPFVFAFSAIDSSATGNNVDFLRAGDVVTFTLFVTNTSTQGAVSTAYDMILSDTLPVWMVFGGPIGSTPPPDAVVDTASGTQIGWHAVSIGGSLAELSALAPGASITPLVFTATVTATVAAGRQDNSQFRVVWRDLPADEPPQQRDYNLTLRSMNVSIIKTEVDAFDPQGRVVVNEPITYTIVVSIPAGTTVYSPAHVFDTLNDGLNYSGEVSHSGLTLPAVVGPSGNNTSIMWTLTNTVIASADVTMTFVFTAFSDGTFVGGPIARGATLNNTANMRWNIGTGTGLNNPLTPQSTAGVQFVRPDIQPGKDSTPSSVISAGGETIQYRITNVRNSPNIFGDPTAADAFDVLVTDTLPAGFGFVEAVPPPNGVFTVGNTVVLTWGVAPTLPVGYFFNPPGITTTTVTWYITATAPLTFAAGLNFTNTVVVQYSDQAGDVPGEQTYFFTRTKVLGVNFFETKAVAPTAPLRIGDLITYTIADSIPAGAIMYWPRHQDDLPQGVRFVTGSMTLQSTTFVSSPIPITVTQGQQERLLWWTNTISNLFGSGPLLVTATFQARLAGVNVSGGAVFSSTGEFRGLPGFNNGARVDWSTQDISDTLDVFRTSNSVPSQVAQPFLADSPFAKSFGGSTSGSTTVGAGDIVTYHIVITNTGRGTAYDVVISDTLPPGAQFDAFAGIGRDFTGAVFTPTFLAAPSLGATGSIGWVIDAIPPGDGNTTAPSTIFTLTYSALISDAIGAGATLPNLALLADYSSLPGDDPFERHYDFLLGATRVVTLNTPSAAIAKSVNVTGATWLDLITYTLTFPQPPVKASLYNVTITDTIPSEITVLGVQAAGGVGTQVGFSGSVVTATATSVAPLSQIVVTITGQIDAGASGAKVNTALLEWDDAASGGSRHAAVSNPASTTIRLPELTIAKSGPSIVGLGANVLYTLVVTNSGTAAAQNVTLTDDLPNELAFASFSASATVTQTASPDPLGFDLGALAPGQTRTLLITATSPLTLTPNSLLTNTATVSTTSPGDNPANNTAQHVATVSGVVLDIRKTANVSSVAPAGTIVYMIEYSNTGTAPATGVVVTDTYDPNVTFVAANPAPNVSNNVWTTPGTLNPGERRTIVVTVTVASVLPNGTPITNLATVGADSTVSQQSTNVVTVTSSAVLTLDKTGHGATMPGYTIVYRLDYANVGNAPAASVRLTETYPSALTFVAADPPPTFGNNMWDLGTLTPPASGTVVVTLTVGSSVPLGTVFTNTVALGSDQTGAVTDAFQTRVGPLYLPLVMKNFAALPNLVVQNVVVTPASPVVNQPTIISVTIANSGSATAPAGFWLDLYVDPAGAPQPGQRWDQIAPVGKAWVLRVPLLPGQSITLDTTMPDDPNDPSAVYSNWPGWFTSPGTHTLYAQVDAFGGTNGLVVELSELDNLFGPLAVTVNPSGSSTHDDEAVDPPPIDPRPTVSP